MQIFSFQRFLEDFPTLLPYLPITIGILGLSVIFSLAFGMFLTWCKFRKNRVVRAIVNIYTQIIRGTPFIVLLFLVYFGLPVLCRDAFGIDISGWSRVVYIVMTLSTFGSCRMSEAMRAAYLSVPKDQMEAAYSCGLSTSQGFWHIVFPQTTLLALPNLCNLIISNLLETSVGFSIGIIDFFGNARLVITRSYGVGALEVYLVVAVVYWLMSILLQKISERIEFHLKVGQGLLLTSGR